MSELAAAMEERDPDRVSAAARAAAAWQGEDAALDRLLGDALANVLMRPEEGVPLLDAHQLPEDPAWRTAWTGAMLRQGDIDGFVISLSATHPEPIHIDALLMGQLRALAIRDPKLDLGEVARIIDDCTLIDAQPRAGRARVERPAPRMLVEGAMALGARRVSFSRGERPGDPPLGRGQSPFRCQSQRRLGPESYALPLPRALTVGATDGTHRVYLTIRQEGDALQVLAGWPQDLANRWLDAADRMERGGVELVHSELGEGLAPPGSAPTETPAPDHPPEEATP